MKSVNCVKVCCVFRFICFHPFFVRVVITNKQNSTYFSAHVSYLNTD
jgi:hypothetical protein